ncbi:reticulocalbin-3 isoform 2-T3 [Erethizon dorsatum]
MWRQSLLLLLLPPLLRGAQGKPSPDAGPHGQARVHQAAPLSDAPHDDAHGNFQYDHEAFLGREVAKEFDQLTPEESQARLGRIVDRMDLAGDGDGWVSLAELRAWIAHTQQRHIRDSVSAAWNTYDTDRDGRVGWEELRNATYGHYAAGEEFHDVEDAETYKKMLARDERRFRVADQDGDSLATREELTAFLHPEEFPHMRDIVIARTCTLKSRGRRSQPGCRRSGSSSGTSGTSTRMGGWMAARSATGCCRRRRTSPWWRQITCCTRAIRTRTGG